MLRKWYRYWTERRWTLGIALNSLEGIMEGEDFQMRPLRLEVEGHWFADPFILLQDEKRLVLLAEDFDIKKGYGCISRLCFDTKTLVLQERKVVLDLGKHISFPFILKTEKGFVMVPECSTHGRQYFYELDSEGEQCREIARIEGVEWSDAVIEEGPHGWLLYCMEPPQINGQKLHVYALSEDFKQATFVEERVFEVNIARMGGDFFTYQGKKYRPAQFCHHYYGEGISIQTMDGKEVRRLFSPLSEWPIGPHTFQVGKDLIVVDMCRFVHPCIGKILYRLAHIIILPRNTQKTRNSFM